MTAFDRFKKFEKTNYNGQDWLKNHILDQFPVVKTDNVDNVDLSNYDSKYVWIVDQSITTFPGFPWYFKPAPELEPAVYSFPYVHKESRKIIDYKRVRLVPTNVDLDAVEENQQTFICGQYDVYKGQDKFDIFHIGTDSAAFSMLKEKHPRAQMVATHQEAQEKSFTDMFWAVYDDTVIRNTFKFSYKPDDWSLDFVHVFGNGDIDRLDGVVLFPKEYNPTEKELEHRFYANKKEIRIMASTPKPYATHYITSFEDYEKICNYTTDDLFWFVPNDIVVDEEFDFNLTFSKQNVYDRTINHVFLNNDSYDGIMLLSTHAPITRKEFEHRFLSNKKEWDIVASQPKPYDRFTADTWVEYNYALENSSTDMFWIDSKNIDTSEFSFDLYFTHHNTYDRNINHVFGHFVNDTVLFNGLFLCSKHVPLDKKEFEYRHIINRKEHDTVASKPISYQTFIVDTWKQYQEALETSSTEMFYAVPSDVNISPDFEFNHYFTHDNKFDRTINHVFKNGENVDGIVLYSQHSPITEKEFEHKFIAHKKEYDIIASIPKKFDYYHINTFEEYLDCLEKSHSELFFIIPNDIIILDKTVFDFYISKGNTDRKSNHVFKNGSTYDGIMLMSKLSPVSQKEFDYKFLANRIEHDWIVSKPKEFDRFTIDNWDDYQLALQNTKTDMFWGIPTDVIVNDEFNFESYIQEYSVKNNTQLDRSITHVFLNGEHYDGICLFSKSEPVSEKEVEHRFYADKKEHDVIASTPKKYDTFTINNYEDYTTALYNTTTEMFWGIPSDIEIVEDFDFDLYFSHHNTFDRNINHVFLNGEEYDGLVLFSKNVLVSEKEIEHRFYIKKKEQEIVASNPKPFPIYEVNSYQDYLDAKNDCNVDMFFITNNSFTLNPNFDENFYISHHNQYERKINHVWKNGDYYDGVALISKHINISQREIDYRFFAIKKEYDVSVSTPNPYDIVFISNGEPNADINYDLLCERFPRAKRVQNIKGIHQAHKRAAELVETDMFWVVDADAEILENFDFEHYVPAYDIDGKDTVHVWRSFNPINGLVYGYGGVKLLPTQLTRDVDVNTPDMTTSISDKFKGIDEMSNTTAFNTDALSAWRSGFRECAKLASKTIARQKDDETEFRLEAWCTRGADKPFGKFAIAGAKAGKLFGEENKDNAEELKKINDFEWLAEQFRTSSQQDE